MTNKEIESYRNSYKVVNGIGFCRVNNDINGNPRYVVHFLAFTTEEEMRNDNLSQNQLYAIAKKRANDLGFSVYRANWYGGGFVGNEPVLVRQETDNKLLVRFLGDAWCPDIVEEWVKRIEHNKNNDVDYVIDTYMFGVIENDRERKSSDFHVSFYYRG